MTTKLVRLPIKLVVVHGGFWLPQLDHNDLLLAVVAAW